MEFESYLTQRGISSDKCSIYHPAGNGQTERTVQTVWKTVQLAIKTANLPHERWEMVWDDALHSIRSLLCTATNTTPHERFFAFQGRSTAGASLPTWMTYPNAKASFRRFVRTGKSDPFVDEVDIINVNPNYANVRHLNGREVTVSLQDLAPCPSHENFSAEEDEQVAPSNENAPPSQISSPEEDNPPNKVAPAPVLPRKSLRKNKGMPSFKHGIHDPSE